MTDYGNKCPICENTLPKRIGESGFYVECSRCGSFTVERHTLSSLPHQSDFGKDKHLVSGYYRYCQEYDVQPVVFHWPENKEKILSESIVPNDKDVNRKLEFVLRYFDHKCESIGKPVMVSPLQDYPIGFSRNPVEFFLLLEHLKGSDFLYYSVKTMHNGLGEIQIPGPFPVSITIQGRAHFSRTGSDNNQIFIAMEFNEEMLTLFARIRSSIENQTGYKLALINDFKHNGTIDNKIIAEINRSAALIADFSSNNRGAYYEAGYAHGQGKEVIFICKDAKNIDGKPFIETVHFDTRQRNHILWKDAEHLKGELIDWIRATLPRK